MGELGAASGLRVLALDATGWMDAVLGERCSCASPLSVSLFSVIIDKEMMRVAQQTRKKKKVPQTVSGSQQTPTLSHSSCAAGYMSTSHELVRAAAGSAAISCVCAPHTSCELELF